MSANDPRYNGGPARSFMPIAHSRREQPYRWERWPPHGWSEHGLVEHWHRFRVARSLLVAIADPQRDALSAVEAREAEARQLGQDAERKLRDAHEAVLKLTNIGDADTSSLDLTAVSRNQADLPSSDGAATAPARGAAS